LEQRAAIERVGSDLHPEPDRFVDLGWSSEDEAAAFDIPSDLRRVMNEDSGTGAMPWLYAGHLKQRRSARSTGAQSGSFWSYRDQAPLKEAPSDARYLAVSAKTPDLEVLPRFEQLEMLSAFGVGEAALEIIGRLPSLRILEISAFKTRSLRALAGLQRL